MEQTFTSSSPAVQSVVEVADHGVLRSSSLEAGAAVQYAGVQHDILLFCVREGRLHVQASFIPHPIELSDHEAIFLAYPRGEWQVRVAAEKNTRYFVLELQVSTMHLLMNPSFDTRQLENSSPRSMRDLMRLIPVSPSLMLCFDQLAHQKLNPPFDQLFGKAKFLEIFSLLMESAFGHPAEICPVAMSPSIEEKLYQVRRYIVDHPDESPDLDTLALQYELPKNTLKEGYKYKFGKTIHQYHADHRLESAMQMLTSGEMLVKEIAFRIGYQNPSHFIAAFKKKFGSTPKQFLKT